MTNCDNPFNSGFYSKIQVCNLKLNKQYTPLLFLCTRNLNSPYNQINQQQTFGDSFHMCSFHQEA